MPLLRDGSAYVGLAMLLALLLAVLLPAPTPSLPPDSLRPTSPVRRLAGSMANDFFFGTDYYFTQGIMLEWVSPVLARSPANFLLPKGPAGGVRTHGMRLHYDGFTPLNINTVRIRFGDRPYAAYFYVSMYRASNQAEKKQRLTTALELGYIGPAAGGKFIQTKIHELAHFTTPRGWDNQVRADAVLGYRVSYEKQLLAAGRVVEGIGTAEASLSTLYTYAEVGGLLRIGHFAPYFANPVVGPTPRASRWQCYGQATVSGRLVGYDATLQGGVFDRSSPYKLAASQVQRTSLHSTGSFVLTHNEMSYSATAVYVGPEFTKGRSHRWGVLAVARTF
jgi:lipid A 3-O-deacylase